MVTESRLLALFDLLKQMRDGSEADPAKRIAELHKKRDEIDAEIARVLAGDVPLLAIDFRGLLAKGMMSRDAPCRETIKRLYLVSIQCQGNGHALFISG